MRTSGCNLRCWFCDTPYTSWEPEQTRRDWQSLLDEVLAIDCRHVVVTGGEPFLQPEVVPLTQALQAAGRHVTIETAGTIYRPAAADLISLSPKLANSTPTDAHRPDGGKHTARHERLREQPDVVRRLTNEFDYQIKFVVDHAADLPEIDDYLDRYRDLERDKVYLMPQARTTDELAEKAPWVEREATLRGLRSSPRLHVELWGNLRGV